MRTNEPDPDKTVTYDSSIVEVLRNLCDLNALLGSLEASFPGQIQHYPSGALRIESVQCICAFERGAAGFYHAYANSLDDSHSLLSHKSVLGSMGFYSLAAFPNRRFEIRFIANAARKLQGSTIFVISERVTGGALREPDCSEQSFTLFFKQKLKDQARQLVATILSKWIKSVCAKGLFSEGPIRLRSANVSFGGTYARFRCDVSGSGMCSIVALLLELIANIDRLLLTEVNFTDSVLHYHPHSVPRIAPRLIEDIYGPILCELPIDASTE